MRKLPLRDEPKYRSSLSFDSHAPQSSAVELISDKLRGVPKGPNTQASPGTPVSPARPSSSANPTWPQPARTMSDTTRIPGCYQDTVCPGTGIIERNAPTSNVTTKI